MIDKILERKRRLRAGEPKWSVEMKKPTMKVGSIGFLVNVFLR